MAGQISADVAILTPIAEEWHAVVSLLESPSPTADQTLPNKQGRIGSHSVVCVLSGKGEGNTASAVQFTSDLWKPRWLFVVGIAGGFPERKVFKGDLVIAQFVYDFDFGKVQNGAFVRRPEYDYACDRSLLGHAEILAANKAKPWLSFISAQRPDGASSSESKVQLGYLASSNKVIDDPDNHMYSAVKAAIPEIHAVEMEASGAGAAMRLEASRRMVGILVIRGISDAPGAGTGSEERAAWKEYAASIAAAFAKGLLLSLSTPDPKVDSVVETSSSTTDKNHSQPRTVAFPINNSSPTSWEQADAASLRRFCEDHLKKHIQGETNRPTLEDASHLAFRLAFRKDVSDHELQYSPVAFLVKEQPAISNFLVATHVVASVRELARGKKSAEEDLAHDLPASVTSYVKQLVNSDPRLEMSVVNAARYLSEESPLFARLTIYYLLGRVQDQEAHHFASILLSEAKEKLTGQTNAAPESSSRTSAQIINSGEYEPALLLLRTIYISLITLGSPGASDGYLAYLLLDQDARNLNSGFHLQYYGDYRYDERHSNVRWFGDLGGDFGQTAKALGKRIKQAIDGNDYPLRDVEIFTLASLAQVRQSTRILNEDLRQDIRGLIVALLNARLVKFSPLVRYLKLIAHHLTSPQYAIGEIAESLYRLKSQQRTGWLDRAVGESESVADHTLGAYLLGLLYLPEKNYSWTDYDKHKVLSIVLVHDLSEAFTQDPLSSEQAEDHIASEKEVFDYLEALTTYPGIYGLMDVVKLGQLFDSGDDFNAKVARDLDRLDCLMQLHIYRNEGHQIPDFDQFSADLMSSVLTEPGQRILEILRENFERSTRRANAK